MAKTTRCIPTLVSPIQNDTLMPHVAMEEVDFFFFRMPMYKALGLDDMTSYFYKAFWSFKKEDVQDVVDSQLIFFVLLACNATLLARAPKKVNSEDPSGFHPIALCNTTYKIISKVIADQLKPILPSLISLEQISYVKGRKILDGIILAQNLVHSHHH